MEGPETRVFHTVIVGRVWGEREQEDVILASSFQHAHTNELQMAVVEQYQWTQRNEYTKVLQEPLNESVRIHPSGRGVREFGATHGPGHHRFCETQGRFVGGE